MTTIKIDPIKTKTLGGLDVEITGIRLGTSDFITGEITGPARQWQASWDAHGLCRDNDPVCNLDISDQKVSELIEDAKSSAEPQGLTIGSRPFASLTRDVRFQRPPLNLSVMSTE